MEAVYMAKKEEDKPRVAVVGDVVMGPGFIRGIVITVKGTFVTVLAIGTSKESGDTFVLTPRFIHDFPASDCSYMEKQTLNQ
jgi:hypothetical protein